MSHGFQKTIFTVNKWFNIRFFKGRKLNTIEVFLLLTIWAITCYLRVSSALTNPVWFDEIVVHTLASLHSFKDLFLVNHWDTPHPPLLTIFIKIIISANNYNFVSAEHIRAVLAFISSFTIFPLYLITKKIVKNWNAFFPSLWFMMHPFQQLNGYQLRPYGLLQFMLTVFVFTFPNSAWTSRKKIFLINTLFIFAFLWDYASIWFFIPFFFYQLLFNNTFFLKRLKQLFPFIFICGLWIFFMIEKLITASEIAKAISSNPEIIIYHFLNLSELWMNHVFVNIFVVCLIFANLFILFKSKSNFSIPILLSALLPLTVATIVSYTISNILVDHNLLFPSIAIIFSLSGMLKYKKIGFLYGVLIFLFFGIYTHTNRDFETWEIYPQMHFEVVDNNRVLFLQYNDNMMHPIVYFLLKNGYQYVAERDQYIKDDVQISWDIINIDNYVDHNSFRREVANYEKVYFLYQIRNVDQQMISEVEKVCENSEKIFRATDTQNLYANFVECDPIL